MNKISISFVIVLILIAIKASPQISKNNYVTTDDGTKLFVKKSGNGPVCIFIHGGPGAWSQSFEGLKGNNLETELSMIYYDQRGCGRSENSVSGSYSMERMIKDIDLIRKHFSATKVYLIAHSFGGILAANYCLRYPKHVKGLILVNSTLNLCNSLENQITYINGLLKTNFSTTINTTKSLMSTFLDAKRAITSAKLNYKLLSDNKSNVDSVEKIDHLNPSSYDFARKAFQIDEYWKDYTKITKNINLPVLIITGEKDHSIGENHYLLFKFKNSTVNKINGGHILYYENNKDFTHAVFSFIKSQIHKQP